MDGVQLSLFGEGASRGLAPPEKPCVLISRCLLGVSCRYHGRDLKEHSQARRLRKRYRLVDVCPEVDAGLPTPRPPTYVVEGRWMSYGRDLTDIFWRGAELALEAALEFGCQRAYLLRGSPACGIGYGAAALLLAQHGIEVFAV
mgnify:FL=1